MRSEWSLLQSAPLLLRSAYEEMRNLKHLDTSHDVTFTNVAKEASLEPERVATQWPTDRFCDRVMYGTSARYQFYEQVGERVPTSIILY